MKKTILIGQSDLTILEILKNNLANDFHVISKVNGLDVFNYLYSNEKVDALILDVFLPKLNGIEILEQIKRSALFTDLPVIILTDANSQLVKEKCLASGAVEYMTKPFDPLELHRLMHSVLFSPRVLND